MPGSPSGGVFAVLVPLIVVASTVAQPQSFTWYRSHLPSEHDIGPLVYDQGRSRIVMLGEVSGVVWELDGGPWLERWTANGPAPRERFAMAHDPVRRRTVVFGGSTSDGYRGDTWEWDGANWLRLLPQTSPAPRSGAAMSFDPVRGRCVLFGGESDSTGQGRVRYGDTWEWDGTNWTLLSPASSPASRCDHLMVTDSGRGRILLFGGAAFPNPPFSDLWDWDGSTWASRPSRTSPPPSSNIGAAYDAAHARLVLTVATSWPNPTATWEWDDSDWSQRQPALSPPAAGRLAYDEVRREIVMHGLVWPQPHLATWAWNGTDWRQLPMLEHPTSARIDYDTARRTVVGAAPGPSRTGVLRICEWSGSRWTYRSSLPAPSAANSFELVYDSGRNRLVVVSAADTTIPLFETWEWDGSGWVFVQPPTSPPPRLGFGLAYDPLRRRVVLHGGGVGFGRTYTPYGDTWEWDGTTWTLQGFGLAAGGPAMAWDPVLQRVLRFGGRDRNVSYGETAVWDGSTWTVLQPPSIPGAGTFSACTDLDRGRLVLTGGFSPIVPSRGIWEWNGRDWLWITDTLAPQLDDFAFDGTRQRFVGIGYPDQTWLGGTMVAAAADTFGAACSGSQGAPRLDGSRPRLGATCLLDLLSARPSAPAVIALSVLRQAQPVGPCTFYLLPPIDLRVSLTNVTGFASRKLDVPALASLRGAVLHAQAVVLDPLGAAGGLALSAGRRLSIGD